MTDKALCIFHGACDDGFTSAFIVRDVLGADRVEFYPGVYQKPPPDVTGRDVIMVDFSYKRPVIDEMVAKCRSLLILDHHKTAMDDLGGLSNTPAISWYEWKQDLDRLQLTAPKVGVLFDMGRSGAGICRDFFYNLAHGAAIPPAIDRFVDYIQDRDLWTKALPEGDQFTIALRSYPQDFETWQVLIARGVPRLIEEGRGIWRYYRGACASGAVSGGGGAQPANINYSAMAPAEISRACSDDPVLWADAFYHFHQGDRVVIASWFQWMLRESNFVRISRMAPATTPVLEDCFPTREYRAAWEASMKGKP